MIALESLVPGFDRAIARMPGAAPAWRVLTKSTEAQAMPRRSAALVNLAVAQQAGGDYARWAMARLAARQGVCAEDIFLAGAGCGRDAHEAAIVQMAHMMASNARFTDTAAYRSLTALLGFDGATHMLAHVALALLACDVLDSVAPGRQAAWPSRRGA